MASLTPHPPGFPPTSDSCFGVSVAVSSSTWLLNLELLRLCSHLVLLLFYICPSPQWELIYSLGFQYHLCGMDSHIYISSPEPSSSLSTQLPPQHLTQLCPQSRPSQNHVLLHAVVTILNAITLRPDGQVRNLAGILIFPFSSPHSISSQQERKTFGSASKMYRTHAFYLSLLPTSSSKPPSGLTC